MKRLPAKANHGFTMTEFLVAVAVSGIMFGALVVGTISIQKSLNATNRYAAGINNESRLMDYVARDLRRAVRVGTLSGTTVTPKKNFTSIAITETNILVINIPDYYSSNVSDNSLGSGFKTTRYPRTSADSSKPPLNTAAAYNSNAVTLLNGCVPWDSAMTSSSGSTPTVKFASTGSGEIQIRYYRGPRSVGDTTVCFFREEWTYPVVGTTPNVKEEIAEQIIDANSTTSLMLSGSSNGTVLLIQSNFTPAYRRSSPAIAGTDQYVQVTLRNARRD